MSQETQYATISLYMDRTTANDLSREAVVQLAENLKTTTVFSHPYEGVEVSVQMIVVDFSLDAPQLFVKGEWNLAHRHSEGVITGALKSWLANLEKRLKWLEDDRECGWFLKHHSWLVQVTDTLAFTSTVKVAEPFEDEWRG